MQRQMDRNPDLSTDLMHDWILESPNSREHLTVLPIALCHLLQARSSEMAMHYTDTPEPSVTVYECPSCLFKLLVL